MESGRLIREEKLLSLCLPNGESFGEGISLEKRGTILEYFW